MCNGKKLGGSTPADCNMDLPWRRADVSRETLGIGAQVDVPDRREGKAGDARWER